MASATTPSPTPRSTSLVGKQIDYELPQGTVRPAGLLGSCSLDSQGKLWTTPLGLPSFNPFSQLESQAKAEVPPSLYRSRKNGSASPKLQQRQTLRQD